MFWLYLTCWLFCGNHGVLLSPSYYDKENTLAMYNNHMIMYRGACRCNLLLDRIALLLILTKSIKFLVWFKTVI